MRYFTALGPCVFRQSQLRTLLQEHRADWKLSPDLTPAKFIRGLVQHSKMRPVILKSEKYRDLMRYSWGEPSIYQLGASLGQDAYLSHGTAVFLHGLTDQLTKTVYVNDEQRPKPFSNGVLTQEGIDAAFTRRQRVSSNVYLTDSMRYLVVSGKHTGRLEVSDMQAPDGARVDVTKLERTLIDIAVRPEYAGGPHLVRDAYEAARDRVSVNVMVATLKTLAYTYPYHQVIGCYMSRAGYSPRRMESLRQFGIRFKFYLTYGMKEPDFDEKWSLFVPKGF